MKIKTNELIGVALDWAVATCEGLNVQHYRTWLETVNSYWKGQDCSWPGTDRFAVILGDHQTADLQKYSSDWSQGGPIIEREGITTIRYDGQWFTFMDTPTHDCIKDITEGYAGSTPLIAAMRCYIASRLGDEVEIPDELVYK